MEPVADDAANVKDDTASGSVAMPESRTVILVRSAVLSGILFLMIMYTLYLAASLLVPITLGFVLSVVLSPLVRLMVRARVPQTLAALFTMLAFVGLLVSIIYAIAQPAIDWMERAPDELQNLEYKLSWVQEPISELKEAREQVDRLTSVGQDDGEARAQPQASFSLVNAVLEATPSVMYGIAVTIVLLFFALAGGDSLLNKAVQISPTLQDKRRVVETGRGIQRHVSAYLGIMCIINFGVGVAVSVAMYLLHMPNPLLWGVLVGVLNFVPYIGVLISLCIVGLVGLLTFESPVQALWPVLAIFGINVLEGQFITPIVAGRRLALSPVAVFLSLVVMGWIWGVAGVLLAVPLLSMVKLVCEEVEALSWVATLLGDG